MSLTERAESVRKRRRKATNVDVTYRSDPADTVMIVYDGGTKRGQLGYGSYQINNYPIVRCNFGPGITNNLAEYHSLISALQGALELYSKPNTIHLTIRGDSMLVVEQVNRRWTTRDDKLKPLQSKAIELLNRFHSWDLYWVSRKEIVPVLGH